MPVITGLQALRQQMEEAQKAREQMKTSDRELKLKGGEIAHIRIVTEAPDIKTGMYHSTPAVSKNGKSYRNDVYCKSPNEECELCNNEAADIKKTRSKMFMWVYLYYVLHSEKRVDSWVKIERAGMTFYKEDVNDFKYIKTGEGWGGYIVSKFLAYYQKYNTLCDRDFEWMRQGSEVNNTVYDLMPEDPSKMDDKIKAGIASLQSLDSIVKGVAPEVKTGDKPTELPFLERLKREKGV